MTTRLVFHVLTTSPWARLVLLSALRHLIWPAAGLTLDPHDAVKAAIAFMPLRNPIVIKRFASALRILKKQATLQLQNIC